MLLEPKFVKLHIKYAQLHLQTILFQMLIIGNIGVNSLTNDLLGFFAIFGLPLLVLSLDGECFLYAQLAFGT